MFGQILYITLNDNGVFPFIFSQTGDILSKKLKIVKLDTYLSGRFVLKMLHSPEVK